MDGLGVSLIRLTILVLGALVLAAPAANAGGADASVDYLEGSTSCTSEAWSEGGSSPDGSFWWYDQGARSGCADDFDYAAAGVEGEDTPSAGARVFATNASSSETQQSGSGSSWGANDSFFYAYTDETTDTTTSGWSRGVTVWAGDERATVGNGCTSSSDHRQASWYNAAYFGPYSSSGGGYEASGSDTYGCSEGLDVDAAGTPARAARADTCEGSSGYSDTWRYDSSGSSSWSSYSSSSSDSHGCQNGLEAQAPGAPLFGGLRDGCSGSSTAWSWYSSDGNASSSSAGSHDETACFSGAAVDGPDDLSLTAGERSWSTTDCWSDDWNQTCESSSDSYRSVRLAWAHNPLGPGPVEVVVPEPEP